MQEFYKLELIVLNDKDLDDSTPFNKANSPGRYNLIVLANAAAIDLYFLCVEDEQGEIFIVFYPNQYNFNI